MILIQRVRRDSHAATMVCTDGNALAIALVSTREEVRERDSDPHSPIRAATDRRVRGTNLHKVGNVDKSAPRSCPRQCRLSPCHHSMPSNTKNGKLPPGHVDRGPAVERKVYRQSDEQLDHGRRRVQARDESGEGRGHASWRPAVNEF